MKVMLDPGHGGKFPGAESEGAVEKDICLAVCRHAHFFLSDAGHDVWMTRNTDVHLGQTVQDDLQERCNQEHEFRPSIFVSVHCNAFSDPNAHGLEIWTSPGQTKSDEYASIILHEMSEFFPNARLRVDLEDGDVDKEANFKVLKGTRGPAVLIEMGFITNPKERAMLNSKEGQQRMAAAIARGIDKCFMETE